MREPVDRVHHGRSAAPPDRGVLERHATRMVAGRRLGRLSVGSGWHDASLGPPPRFDGRPSGHSRGSSAPHDCVVAGRCVASLHRARGGSAGGRLGACCNPAASTTARGSRCSFSSCPPPTAPCARYRWPISTSMANLPGCRTGNRFWFPRRHQPTRRTPWRVAKSTQYASMAVSAGRSHTIPDRMNLPYLRRTAVASPGSRANRRRRAT